MHQIIRIIVYAHSGKDALRRAKSILDNNLVGEGYGLFDYGTFFDNDGSAVSGKGRWGNIPAVVLADSKEGKKFIDDGMKFTKESFLESVKGMRDFLDKYSDEELFEEERIGIRGKILDKLSEEKTNNLGVGYFKYYCRNAGVFGGSNIYLYDDDGEGINKTSHLKKVLDKWGDKNSKKIYVIPVDVHY